MSSSQMYYVTTLLVYTGVDIMACLALNLQFGVSGLVNFGFIVFQAAGAYTVIWVRQGEIVSCPWHAWEFDIATGRTITEPTKSVRTYPVWVEDGQVVLETDGDPGAPDRSPRPDGR